MNSSFEMSSNRFFLLLFLAVALYAYYALVEPLLQSIILAILVGMLAYPAHSKLAFWLKGRRSSAAIINCLVLSLVFLIPLSLLLMAVL